MGKDNNTQSGDYFCCCLFCYRTFNEVTSSENVEETQKLFLILIKRYLVIRTDFVNSWINLFSEDLKLNNKSLRNVISPCADCLEIIKSFCEYYEDIKVLEMKLEWRLQTLTNIVRSSEKVKFRRKLFHEKLEENGTGTGGMDSKGIMKHLKRFRMELLKKCTGRFRDSYPKIELKKCDAFNSNGNAERTSKKRQNNDDDASVDVSIVKVSKLEAAEPGHKKRGSMHNPENEVELISVHEATTETNSVIGSTADDMDGVGGTKLGTAISQNDLNFNDDDHDNGDNSISSIPLHKETSSFSPTATTVTDEVGNGNLMELKTDNAITTETNFPKDQTTSLTAFEASVSVEPNETQAESDAAHSNLNPSSSTSPILFDIVGVDFESVEIAEYPKSPKVAVNKNSQLTDKISTATQVDPRTELAKLELEDVPHAGNEDKMTKIEIPLELHTNSILENEKVVENDDNQSRPETVSADDSTKSPKPSAISEVTPGRRVSLRQRYPCTTCSQKFSSKDKLQEHLKTCVNCEITSAGEEESESEVVNQFSDNDFEDIGIAGSSEEDEDDANVQYILSEEEEDYKISASQSDDGIQCSNSEGRRKHRPAIKQKDYDFMKTLYKCDSENCEFTFYNQANLDNHSKLHGNFKCSSCEITTISYAPELALHELQHQRILIKAKSSNLSCPRENCPYVTKLDDNFIRHFIRCFLKLSLNVHTCPICKQQVSAGTSKSQIGQWNIANHFRNYHDLDDVSPETIIRCNAPECSAYFRTKSQLSHHRSIIHNKAQEGLICEECGDNFTSKILLRRHRKIIHEDGFLRCEVKGCEKRFRFKSSLKVHVSLEHSSITDNSCYFCSKTFESKSLLLLHQNRVHQKVELDLKPEKSRRHPKPKSGKDKVFVCPEVKCSEKFYNRDSLEAHAKLHGNFKCFFCEESKTYAPDLAIHEASCKKMEKSAKRKSRSKNETFLCPHCDYEGTTSEIRYVQHHLRAHLNLDLVVSYMCCICKWVYNDNNYFQKKIAHHYTSYHDLNGDGDGVKQNPFRCDKSDCDAYFLKLEQLSAHKLHVHNENIKYPCPDCDKVCAERRFLLYHRINKHKDKLKFPCTHPGCLIRFEDEKSVQEHLSKRHSKEMTKEEVCSECGKKFQGLNALVMHAKTHASKPKPKTPKIKNFICPECGKSFLGKEKLHNHVLCVHVGPEGWEFSCDTCKKKCMTKQKLEEHQRTHTQEKPFTCEHCGSSYAHRHNFRIHLKSKHGIILKTPKRVRNDAN